MSYYNVFLMFILHLLFSTSFLFAQTLPTETSTLFSGAGNCAACHIAGNGAFTTQTDEDISPITLWRSTMMANAAKDPLWQAKVSAEVAAHPALQSIIEDKCTTCHAPLGRTEAHFHSSPSFAFKEAMADPLSLDGVSCTSCHQIQSSNLMSDESFSGGYIITDQHQIFGPFKTPTTNPMFNQTGYTAVYAEHVHQSEICATCHTLFTPFVDNEGQVVGYFPEQTPYLEWQNSIYSQNGTECQTCHMPITNEELKIAASPPWLTTLRTPIGKHYFVGGNIFMNSLLDMFKTEIGVAATTAQLDSTYQRTAKLLTEQTLNFNIVATASQDSLRIQVDLENLSGHKFPTGFPSRRAWLHVQVKDEQEEILFESGQWDAQGQIIGLNKDFEPHYDTITSPDQVQIYQSVMQDVDDNITHTLLRGAKYVKDNRIPPKGFVSNAQNYESIQIYGKAAIDKNFNKKSNEGSGSDQVFYNVNIADKGTNFQIFVEILYQSVAPEFANDLFAYQTEKTQQFQNYYKAVDQSPFTLASRLLNVSATKVRNSHQQPPSTFDLLKNFPNPFNPNTNICYTLIQSGYTNLSIYDLCGSKVITLVDDFKNAGTYNFNFNASFLASGIYLCKLQTANGTKISKMTKIQ